MESCHQVKKVVEAENECEDIVPVRNIEGPLRIFNLRRASASLAKQK